MRLFSQPDGGVDQADRASWLTGPFDRLWQAQALTAYSITFETAAGTLTYLLCGPGVTEPGVGVQGRRGPAGPLVGATGLTWKSAPSGGVAGMVTPGGVQSGVQGIPFMIAAPQVCALGLTRPAGPLAGQSEAFKYLTPVALGVAGAGA